MRNTLFFVCLLGLLVSCKKDKFTTAPQIKFVDLKPNTAQSDINSTTKQFAPKLIFKITDAEGDFGTNSSTDSSMIYVRHLLTNNIDSFPFPDLTGAAKTDFDAEITINLFDALYCYSPGPLRPRTDTVFYEFYVQDAKKNKSNVVRTPRPLYYRCL
jgi:hypothetical protein